MVATTPYEDRWQPSQIQECVDLWDLTEDETTKLMQLKERVADVDHWKNDPFELARFLKTPMYYGDVNIMEQRFRNSIQWRQKHQVDTILQDYAPPILYNLYPMAVMEGCDKAGDFVLVGRIGVADTLGLLRRFGKDEAIQTFLWYYELLTRGPWQQERKERLRAATVVYDLKGLSRRHYHPSLVMMSQEILHIEKTLYPNWGKKLLIVNCPPLISLVWAIFRPLIPPLARKKFEFATEEQTEELVSKHMDVRILPKEILPGKGHGKAVRGFEPVWGGGPLPPSSDDDWKRRDPITEDSEKEAEDELWESTLRQRRDTEVNEMQVSSRSLIKGSWDSDDDASFGRPSVMLQRSRP